MWCRGFNDFPVWHFDVVQEGCAGAVSLTPRVSRVGPQLDLALFLEPVKHEGLRRFFEFGARGELGLGDFVLAPERVEDAALGWVEFVQA